METTPVDTSVQAAGTMETTPVDTSVQVAGTIETTPVDTSVQVAGTMKTTPVDTSVQAAGTMETTSLAAGTMETARFLTRFVIIKSTRHEGKGYAHSNDAGFVILGEQNVFSARVKIEAEPARSDRRYVNLRLCYTNKYWAARKTENHTVAESMKPGEERIANEYIVAESTKPEEDTKKKSCTLFEPLDMSGNEFLLRHVHSGLVLQLDSANMRFFINSSVYDSTAYLSYVNWESLVKLPKHVAFKGYNGKYLQEVMIEGNIFLQFSSDDQNEEASGHEVHLMPDGHVRIRSDHWGMYWKYEINWIWADSVDPAGDGKTTLFWPVKIDSNTISLRSAGNGKFCKALTADSKVQCLNAGVTSTTSEARMVVNELVLGRRIYNVRYWIENSRVYKETPYVAGTTTAFNYTDAPATVAVEVNYIDTKARTFSHSYSLKAGVKASFVAGVPFITSAGIEVSIETGVEVEWGKTETDAVSVKATGTVTVPEKKKATISYVGTKAMCDVPFSYTQEDRSSTNGEISETDHIDGIFTGVNAYNFSFHIEKTTPL